MAVCKKIFLYAPSGEGKSTLIFGMLGGNIKYAAGYRTARVFSTEGKRRGYCQYPADTDIGLEISTDDPLTNNILKFEDGAKTVDRAVFTGFTVPCLRQGIKECEEGRRKFVLTDEIGGIELTDPVVFAVFNKLLDADVPVIGVLKVESMARFFVQNSSGNETLEPYERLKKRIEEQEDCLLLEFKREDHSRCAGIIRQWMRENSITSGSEEAGK